MSRSVTLYFADAIAEDEFVRFSISMGGWLQDQGPDRLDISFSEGDVYVWIYGERGSLCDPTDGDDASRPFGLPPKSSVTLVLSKVKGSDLFALKIAHSLLSRWPGVASFPLHTILAPHGAMDVLPQAVAEGFAGSEMWLLLTQLPNLDAVIEEFEGLAIGRGDAELHASAVTTLEKGSRVEVGPDTVAGVVQASKGYVWILTAGFDEASIYRWDLLGPLVSRCLGQSPARVVRVVIDSSSEDRGEANRLALSLAKRLSNLTNGALCGTFFVALEVEQVKLVLDSGQWPLIT